MADLSLIIFRPFVRKSRVSAALWVGSLISRCFISKISGGGAAQTADRLPIEQPIEQMAASARALGMAVVTP
jgi:hypothetical protein